MSKKLIILLLLSLSLLALCPRLYAQQDPLITEVRYNFSEQFIDPKQNYYIALLDLVLKKSEPKYGAYKLTPVPLEMPQGRTIKLVEQNKHIDIVWTMTSIERENQLKAIYIPLLKGLMGYRIGIIRKGEQGKFDEIDTLASFKKITIGQGKDWPDVEILRLNGFNVVPGADQNLLAMLAKNRFDYFPRTLNEPWHELTLREDVELEQNLLLHYPAPIYFFVNKQNHLLAERIEFGLRVAISDGSFDDHFFNNPINKNMITKSNLFNRQEYEIANPLLSPQSAEILNETSLWLTVIM
ncbi:hypothetical protein [Shewanella aestuarii]|uniref:Amino acid ABC transporter substrate-binding protein n=1 Tax=Shewanella aestuarii TaxID=1028752 RepID=A0A6G9QK16_9GAMM|nr:hypothetical protein [Shewanella aestuarii]QIR14201.1 hypothetical protein HBH39_06620 [Shewanella aestuarii]